MTLPTRRTLVVGGAGAALLVALVTLLTGDPGETGATPSPLTADGAATPGDVPVVSVNLDALQRTRPDSEGAQRNLFRFEARPTSPLALPSAPAAPGGPPVPVAQGPGRSGSPPPPPIPVRFIGMIDAPVPTGQVVFFSDGRGNVFFGREGDTIEGRYKVLKVSPDAAELSYLDGRGRQTIPMSGQ